MNDLINIYFNSNVLQLVEMIDANSDLTQVIDILHSFKESENQSIKVYVNNLKAFIEHIHLTYPKTIAGGGVIQNEKNEILFIYRRKKWDLPKGKLDNGETIEECAIREVKEETGVENITLQDFLCCCYHIYFDKWQNKYTLKETHWYNMFASSSAMLTPQTEEDIDAIQWVAKSDLNTVFQNTYESIKEVIGRKFL